MRLADRGPRLEELGGRVERGGERRCRRHRRSSLLCSLRIVLALGAPLVRQERRVGSVRFWLLI